jgi:hypothetical protein
MKLLTLVTFIGLILGIAGVSSSDKGDSYQPSTLAKAAMGIFLAVFAIFILLTVWLYYELSFSLRRFQKKLFIAIALSSPFLLVRLVYSALSDYTTYQDFSLYGNATVYLCMAVLEEIIAMTITMALGISAVLEKDFVKVIPVAQEDPERPPMGV